MLGPSSIARDVVERGDLLLAKDGSSGENLDGSGRGGRAGSWARASDIGVAGAASVAAATTSVVTQRAQRTQPEPATIATFHQLIKEIKHY